MASDVLERLTEIIRERRHASADKSYTRQLLNEGPRHCAKKFGEEAVELAMAVAGESDIAVKMEAADVVYHLLVALESRDLAIEDVLKILEGRFDKSGLAEKAARQKTEKQT